MSFSRGSRHAPETIERMRAAQAGKKHSQETIDKIRASNPGIRPTPEARAKMSASKKRNWVDPAYRAMMIAAQMNVIKRAGLLPGAEDDYWTARRHLIPMREAIKIANASLPRKLRLMAVKQLEMTE